MPTGLDRLAPHIPAWALVLFRLIGLFLFAPALGSRVIPVRVKVLLAVALSFCLYPMLLNPARPSAALIGPVLDGNLTLWMLAAAVAMELMIGLAVGYCASLPLIGAQLGGRLIDQQMGLGLAGVLNPEFDEETGIISEFYFLLALTMFLILGGHEVLLKILATSFDRIPLGGFRADAGVLSLIMGLLGLTFELAIRVAAPLLCMVFLETIAMGFIARTVPQMNILSIGFPLRILAGAALLAAAVGVNAAAVLDMMRRMLGELARFFGS